MMIVPVAAVGINHHFTILGDFAKVWRSPTLRFSVLGAMMYTLTSFEGSMQSLRTVNRLTHFTHFTVAHAHFGVYGFVSFTLFGGIYFLLPRLVGREWPYPKLVSAHFWLAFVGIAVYVVGLSIGGVLQGLAMLDPAKPFMASVDVTLPWLHTRTVGGILMTVAHVVFAVHVGLLVRAKAAGPSADGSRTSTLMSEAEATP
jgi:cytochrome c oxidase cbb3-type subunit 1